MEPVGPDQTASAAHVAGGGPRLLSLSSARSWTWTASELGPDHLILALAATGFNTF